MIIKNKFFILVFILFVNIIPITGCGVDKKKLNENFINACIDGKVAEVKRLINEGADINVKDNNKKWNCLLWASHKRHLSVIQFIIENFNRLQINRDTEFDDPLGIGVIKGYPEIVKYILKKFPNIIKEKKLDYMLLNACSFGLRGAEDDIKSTPKDYYEIAKLLVEHGVNINLMNENGQTPLGEASRWGNIDIVKYLISKGANVNLRNGDLGVTSLMLALENNSLEIVKYLVDHGAKVDHINEAGETALILASRKGYLDIVKFLVSRGANINAVARKGSPLSYAINNQQPEVANYLRSIGARFVPVQSPGM